MVAHLVGSVAELKLREGLNLRAHLYKLHHRKRRKIVYADKLVVRRLYGRICGMLYVPRSYARRQIDGDYVGRNGNTVMHCTVGMATLLIRSHGKITSIGMTVLVVAYLMLGIISFRRTHKIPTAAEDGEGVLFACAHALRRSEDGHRYRTDHHDKR